MSEQVDIINVINAAIIRLCTVGKNKVRINKVHESYQICNRNERFRYIIKDRSWTTHTINKTIYQCLWTIHMALRSLFHQITNVLQYCRVSLLACTCPTSMQINGTIVSGTPHYPHYPCINSECSRDADLSFISVQSVLNLHITFYAVAYSRKPHRWISHRFQSYLKLYLPVNL